MACALNQLFHVVKNPKHSYNSNHPFTVVHIDIPHEDPLELCPALQRYPFDEMQHCHQSWVWHQQPPSAHPKFLPRDWSATRQGGLVDKMKVLIPTLLTHRSLQTFKSLRTSLITGHTGNTSIAQQAVQKSDWNFDNSGQVFWHCRTFRHSRTTIWNTPKICPKDTDFKILYMVVKAVNFNKMLQNNIWVNRSTSTSVQSVSVNNLYSFFTCSMPSFRVAFFGARPFTTFSASASVIPLLMFTGTCKHGAPIVISRAHETMWQMGNKWPRWSWRAKKPTSIHAKA